MNRRNSSVKIVERGGGNKDVTGERRLIAFELFIMFSVCILHAVNEGHYANFYPINGTFQNYNPIRRLLSGQIPYLDFQDYLGIGHLFTGTAITALFGGDYQGSLMAFAFLSVLSFALISLMLGSAVFRKKLNAVSATNLILLMLLIQPLFYSNAIAGTDDIKEGLSIALKTGNSARFVRGMILPISCGLLYLAYICYKKIIQRNVKLAEKKFLAEVSVIGLIAGFSFVWSNDYGISCWVCLMIMTFAFLISRTRKIWIAVIGTVAEFVVSIAGIFIFAEIFTLGHAIAWLKLTFGTGDYQRWYYGGNKSYYLYDIDLSYIMVIQALLSLVYLIKFFRTRAKGYSLARYGIPAYANMVSFCAVNEYRLLSGGSSREVAFSVLFVTILFESAHFISSVFNEKKIKKMLAMAAGVIGVAWIVSILKDEIIFWKITGKEGEYVEALGGNMTSLASELSRTSFFLNGNIFFATYASAQEVVEDIFQPSGTDYIIHVLGDSQREEYLNTFRDGDFKYAATIRPEYTTWEYWIQRANWFFYRELYQRWHPVFANAYELYWERNENGITNVLSGNYEVEVYDVDGTTKKLVIQTDSTVSGIADVYIDYAVKKNSGKLAQLVFQTTLKVNNTGTVYADDAYYESNHLRAVGREYIPIPIIDGYGEVTLTSYPTVSTYLELYETRCSEIYYVDFDYIVVSAIIDEKTESTVAILNNEKNIDSIANIQGIVIDGTTYKVLEMKSDATWIYIIVQGSCDGDILKYNNVFRIVRE